MKYYYYYKRAHPVQALRVWYSRTGLPRPWITSGGRFSIYFPASILLTPFLCPSISHPGFYAPILRAFLVGFGLDGGRARVCEKWQWGFNFGSVRCLVYLSFSFMETVTIRVGEYKKTADKRGWTQIFRQRIRVYLRLSAVNLIVPTCNVTVSDRFSKELYMMFFYQLIGVKSQYISNIFRQKFIE